MSVCSAPVWSPFTSYFLVKVGLNIALGIWLSTSCASSKTPCWRLAHCWPTSNCDASKTQWDEVLIGVLVIFFKVIVWQIGVLISNFVGVCYQKKYLTLFEISFWCEVRISNLFQRDCMTEWRKSIFFCWTWIACKVGLHLKLDCMWGRLYPRTSFIYKCKTSTLTPFVKPRDILNLDIKNIFYVQS